MTAPPLDEYRDRAVARQVVVAARERTHVHLGNAKVAIFLAILAYWAFTLNGDPQPAFYYLAVSTFVALFVWHELTMRALARAKAAVTFYIGGIARIEDRWMNTGPTGERFRDVHHPYADDLDVFGAGSLFQLLSGARTPMGEARLAAWLLAPAAPEAIRERQARVRSLRQQIDLRERIAVVNAASRRRLEPERLVAWAEAPAAVPRLLRPLVVLLALATMAAIASVMAGGSAWPLGLLQLVNLAVMWQFMKAATAVVEALSSATEAAGLDLLSRVIREVEGASFDEPELAALTARLRDAGGRPLASRGIAQLARISEWADSRHNVFPRLLEIPLLFTLQVAWAGESWKARHGARLRDWVEVVGEIEALLSLGGYAYEHPADPFPEIVGAEGDAAMFDGIDIAHPLIPAASAVSNTVGLGLGTWGLAESVGLGLGTRDLGDPSLKPQAPSPQVLIVSGSNMSGKSTLMRTVGLNAVLALAGAPVRASRLRITPMSLGTCLRHTDSLHEGRSGFYTEVLRIRKVCDLLDAPRRVLFLFDELLSGTNSRDRRTAAEALIRLMLNRQAIGMVTTHDLALTEIADIFAADVKNVHLQDHVEDGQMRFDYKLRDGVITQSNALELMRMIGLDV